MSGKIYFKYGTMGSGKSLDLIRAVYNYRERGMNVLVYKSEIDKRDSENECIIKSRTGAEVKAYWLPKDRPIKQIVESDMWEYDNNVSAIFVDEAQFLSPHQVNELQEIAYEYNIPILCYGLLVDFKSELFPGAKRLIEIADDYQELIGICKCGRKAKQNARVVNGRIVKDGDLIALGKNDTDGKSEVYYVALCNKCCQLLTAYRGGGLY